MWKEYKSLPLIKEKMSRFKSISDIPLHLCTISTDSKEFLVYNVEDNKICEKIPIPAPLNLRNKGLICEINGSQLFYLGGVSKEGNPISACLLIDIKTQTVEILKPGVTRCWVAPVYFENYVYAFGGQRAKNVYQEYSDKFSLRKNKWKRIANLPFAASQTHAIVYERKIIVAGRKLENIWKYDTDENSYESLFNINKETWKMLFVLNSQCYVLTNDSCCYSSETNNIKNWTFYGKVTNLYWPCSNPCFYNDCWLFFDNYSQICKFDLNRLVFEAMGRTKDTKKKYNLCKKIKKKVIK